MDEVWLIITIVIDIAVIAANSGEITLLIKKWRNLDRIEHLLLSLSIADFIAGIAMTCQDIKQLVHVVRDNKFQMNETDAIIFDNLFVFCVLVSNFHVISIAVERLTAVVFPMKYSLFTTFKCKAITICFVWCFSIVSTGVIASSFKYKSQPASENLRYLTCAGILLFACISVFMIYTVLFCALVIREREMNKMLPQETRKYLRDKRTTLFCLLIGVTFVVCILPPTLGYFRLYHPIQNLFYTLNHLLNPFIYFAKSLYEKRARSRSAIKYRIQTTNEFVT
ncbi:histamine H2 receptor [Hydra vulgaris]|uniref:histamine H2 receptor n=1 Tax=Hydra vulgaris TaxID=6087 RepID=UPI0001925B08|nr:histamine H2 receptor-like [Hydra vulgaris]